MVIDKIGNINNIVEPKKSSHVSGAKETRKKDSVQISSEGKKAAEEARLTGIAKAASDIRVDRVRELKDAIAKGTYNFDEPKVIEMVADRIAAFLLKK
jgi:flagellar biosynthesis anti-sigma factor FlgM